MPLTQSGWRFGDPCYSLALTVLAQCHAREVKPERPDVNSMSCMCRTSLIMTHTLTAFMELMDHGIVSWENLSITFIKKVGPKSFFSLLRLWLVGTKCHKPSLRNDVSLEVMLFTLYGCMRPSFLCVSSQITGFVNAQVMDASIQQVSLDILESMVLSSFSLFRQIREEITLDRLIAHLQV